MKIDPELLAAEVKRQAAVIDSLRAEIRTQRLEIAGLREERRAVIAADRPQIDRPETLDNTPARHTTPTECTVPPEWTSRPFYVDPPSGWAYGFPRLYDPAKDGDMVAWMIANGYPEKLARQGLACTFTAQE